MKNSIGIIDYGMGNLYSVQQSLIRLNQSIKLVKESEDLNSCRALVLPGVGSFDPAMQNLNQTLLVPYIKEWVNSGKPILGICLGLQLMFESSEEGILEGLGILKGTVKTLPKNNNERIPHMGWSLLEKTNECPLLGSNMEKNWMYFVHSYSAHPLLQDLSATVKFGEENITAIVWKDKIGACQFHPEKSGKAGNKLISRWVDWLDKQEDIDQRKIKF